MGNLVWLASYPKSGNTWMRSFLYNLFSGAHKPADINQLDNFCVGESHMEWYRRRAGRDLCEDDNPYIASIRRDVHRLFTGVHVDSVFVKTHNYLGEAYGHPLHNMDVTAATIYILRNPLDVAASMMDHFQLDLDAVIERLASPQASTETRDSHVFERHADWSTHVRSWTATPHPRMHVVRYEDLMRRPKIHFGKAARFLGLNPDSGRLARAIEFSSFRELRRQEEKKGFRERPKEAKAFFRGGRIGDGRRLMSKAQIDAVIDAHGDVMRRFGYG